MKNLEEKLKVLNERKENLDLREFIEQEATNDPNFFRWLFDEEFEKDFAESLTDEQEEEFAVFMDDIEQHDDSLKKCDYCGGWEVEQGKARYGDGYWTPYEYEYNCANCGNLMFID